MPEDAILAAMCPSLDGSDADDVANDKTSVDAAATGDVDSDDFSLVEEDSSILTAGFDVSDDFVTEALVEFGVDSEAVAAVFEVAADDDAVQVLLAAVEMSWFGDVRVYCTPVGGHTLVVGLCEAPGR